MNWAPVVGQESMQLGRGCICKVGGVGAGSGIGALFPGRCAVFLGAEGQSIRNIVFVIHRMWDSC